MAQDHMNSGIQIKAIKTGKDSERNWGAAMCAAEILRAYVVVETKVRYGSTRYR